MREKIKIREAFLELTNHCNFHCTFCSHPLMVRPKTKMRAADARDILRQIANAFEPDFVSLHLYGEPMLHPHVNTLARYAGTQNLKINLTTNGALLTPEKLKQFLADGIWRLVLSVQHEPEQFDTRKAGPQWTADKYFKHILGLVRLFIAYKREFPQCPTLMEIHYLVTSEIRPSASFVESDRDTEDILSWWKQALGADMTGDTTAEIQDQESGYRISVSTDLFIRFKPAISFGNALTGTKVHECSRGSCFFPATVLCIMADGNMVPCCLDHDGTMPLGNVIKNGLLETWKSEKALDIRRSFEENIVPTKRCRQCLGGLHFGSPI